MSLKTCPDCGQSVSSLAQACPNCARPMSPIAIRPNIPSGVWSPPDHRPAPPAGPQLTRIIVHRTPPPIATIPSRPVLIEKTGKHLKAQYGVSVLLLLVAIVTILARGELLDTVRPATPIGIILGAVALLDLLITRIRIWWHHG